MGDTTGGSVSLASNDWSISERWNCKYVTKTILTHDSHWIEGAGIYPDIVVEVTEADFAVVIDLVLFVDTRYLDGVQVESPVHDIEVLCLNQY